MGRGVNPLPFLLGFTYSDLCNVDKADSSPFQICAPSWGYRSLKRKRCCCGVLACQLAFLAHLRNGKQQLSA
jgi:hypothetical protein